MLAFIENFIFEFLLLKNFILISLSCYFNLFSRVYFRHKTFCLPEFSKSYFLSSTYFLFILSILKFRLKYVNCSSNNVFRTICLLYFYVIFYIFVQKIILKYEIYWFKQLLSFYWKYVQLWHLFKQLKCNWFCLKCLFSAFYKAFNFHIIAINKKHFLFT